MKIWGRANASELLQPAKNQHSNLIEQEATEATEKMPSASLLTRFSPVQIPIFFVRSRRAILSRLARVLLPDGGFVPNIDAFALRFGTYQLYWREETWQVARPSHYAQLHRKWLGHDV
jgi:hypothetical protein